MLSGIPASAGWMAWTGSERVNERLILRRLIARYESRLLDDDEDGRAAGAGVWWVVK